jgi:hypothetical protein
MNSENMRHYMRLVEEADSVLGYALKDALGRFVAWKSGQDNYSKNLRQMWPTLDDAEDANNQRLQHLQELLGANQKRQDDQQISIVQKLIDTPVAIVAITARLQRRL